MTTEAAMVRTATRSWFEVSMHSLSGRDEQATAEGRWIAAAKRGDRDAFGELVRRYERRVFRLASRFFRRPEDVQDAAQDTFLIAWRKLDRYSARAPFEHWLTRVCLNTCYSRLRRNSPEIESLDHDPPEEAHDPDARLDVERLLARLSAEDRFVLVLLDAEGWSVKEISDRLGWTVSKVKVRAHRARKRLRELLDEELNDAV